MTAEGVLHSINVSTGGVPKRPLQDAVVRTGGLEGDRQREVLIHGGPSRAISLYSQELIESLQAEGHPVAAGSMGENLTVSGIDWTLMTPGVSVEVGEVILELTSHAGPCRHIGSSFLDRQFARVSEKVHPGWSRLYARVVREGTIRVGDRVRVVQPSAGRGGQGREDDPVVRR
jgi:MOSC domain-containing protein YiiM